MALEDDNAELTLNLDFGLELRVEVGFEVGLEVGLRLELELGLVVAGGNADCSSIIGVIGRLLLDRGN